MLMAKRTLCSDGLRRHGLYRRRDVLVAALALNHDQLLALWWGKHEASIGEQKEKIIHRFRGDAFL
jgi:hypothetical protein